MRTLATITVAALVALGARVPADTIYVDVNSQSQTEDGSQQNPYKTIQAAILHTGTGHTILVSPGTYAENVVIGEYDVFESTGGRSVTFIDGSSSDTAVTISNVSETVSVSGFTIQNGRAPAGGGLYIYNADALVDDCMIHSNTATSTLYGGGGVYIEQDVDGASPTVTLEDCVITGNSSAGHGGGICMENSHGLVVCGCTSSMDAAASGASLHSS